MKYIEKVIDTLINTKSHRATKYVSDKSIINATRKTYKGKIKNGDAIDIVLTIGRPNYAQREFIKVCKKAGEKFPINNIIIKSFKK